jgi:hypothetical protein
VGYLSGQAMADEGGKRDEKGSKQDRLKSALRENLKRRKAQARERSKLTELSSTDDEACLDGEVGKRGD